ncbi:hypothetical protein AB0I52_14230 [Streptomyces sp. NPDC050423]|uniref:hypothetical protein n=1 Tax=Streptomyces sp. NPDC050423 TaxID=3155402 RepID=UPI00342D264A
MKQESEARMPGIQTDALDAVGALFAAVVGLGCAGWGGRTLLRPHRSPESFEGPAWGVRAWGAAYVVLGICLTIRMLAKLYGNDPVWPMTVTLFVAFPLLICAFTAAYVSRWRARRRGEAVRPGRHKRRARVPRPTRRISPP